jgi:hypothetical protein
MRALHGTPKPAELSVVLGLNPDAIVSRCGDKLIALNINNDTYHVVDRPISDLLPDLINKSRSDLTAHDGLIENLITVGICAWRKPTEKSEILDYEKKVYRATSAKPFVTANNYRLTPRILWALIWIATAHALHSIHVKILLKWILSRPWWCRARSPSDAARQLADFNIARTVYPWPVQCMVLAPALFKMLRARGENPCLAIGVCLDPFEAHAWVELGDMPVNDHVSFIEQFNPILRIQEGEVLNA